jgi:hypothetical protein
MLPPVTISHPHPCLEQSGSNRTGIDLEPMTNGGQRLTTLIEASRLLDGYGIKNAVAAGDT